MEALAAYQREQRKNGLIEAGEVESLKPEYLWEPYLRRNNINVIQGDGGSGKTLLSMAIIAALSHGKLAPNMPGLLHSGTAKSLYLGAEDELGDYKYKLVQCGADCSKVYMCEPTHMPTLYEPTKMRELIHNSGASLVVIDPIQAFCGNSDMNKANEVRLLLENLREICRSESCTAILIAHMNKMTSQSKAVYRINGSGDFINGARSAMLVGYHPKEQGKRVAMQIKSNAAFGQPILFDIDAQGCFIWEGTCDISEAELLEAKRTNAKPKVESPALVLVRYLMQQNGGNGWEGSAAQAIAQGAGAHTGLTDSRSFGKLLPSVLTQLETEGITFMKRTTNKGVLYTFRREVFPSK